MMMAVFEVLDHCSVLVRSVELVLMSVVWYQWSEQSDNNIIQADVHCLEVKVITILGKPPKIHETSNLINPSPKIFLSQYVSWKMFLYNEKLN